ncbi:ABC transporter substrate-binding protein [uncultured Piscinibacter sp.]|uniref:ABC transporter substrate-binding protein n=1 Tax=uncultured Piscinibacter sp. TaxID=1131835 RepID=UPI002630A8B4|nr:ABC transporter substrate-binding protein [uncultured Piscinibacter sp.]
MTARARLGRGLALLACGALSLAAAAVELTAQERAGQRLYREGMGASGHEVSARVGAVNMPVPGRVVPCANCHGRDGLGRPEGGLLPPVITWSELTKAYGHRHDSGRSHPPFDERSLLRAVTQGLDPAGQALDPGMPRYALGREDQDNLVAYLKRLEHDHDPGVAAGALRLGTLLPLSGPQADSGTMARRVLDAYLADLNEGGGLYGRRLELVAVDAAAPREELARRWNEMLAGGDVLALLAPMTPGAEAELLPLAEAQRVPVVGPLGAGAVPAEGNPRYTFFVQAGLRELVRTLAVYATQAAPGVPLLLVAPDDAAHEPLAAALRQQCERVRCAALAAHRPASGRFDAEAALAALAASRAGVVVFLAGEAELEAFLRAADARGRHPTVLLPGALGARAAVRAPAGFAGRILLAYPSAPGEALRAGSRFEAFRTRHALPSAGLATQVAAYAAAALLAEGVRRSGRALGRERLVESLEALRDFRTDAVPPLSYGPDRRIGALGGHIVAVDAASAGATRFRTVSAWQPLE